MEEIPAPLRAYLDVAYRGADEAHDVNHAIAVHRNFCEIVRREGIVLSDRELAMAPYVATLHDVLDHKRPVEGRPSEESVRRFIAGLLGESTADEIMHIHRNCSWSKRDTSVPYPGTESDILRLILQDADWIEALGHEGIQRCEDYVRAVDPDVSPEDLKARVRQHIREKLLLIPDRLNFAVSRELARGLVQPLLEYLVV